MVSHNPKDVKNLYCGHCRFFHASALPMLTIYEHPTDYPDKYVARLSVAVAGQLVRAKEPLGVRDTLKEVQALVPPGSTRLPRDVNDFPSIVEVWI